MFFAALTLDLWPIVGVVLSVFTLTIAGYYAVRYVDATGMRAQLDAKDAVIATNRQTIEAFEGRIEALETQIDSFINKMSVAQDTIDELQRRLDEQVIAYEALESYAAPKAVISIEEKLNQIIEKLDA